MARAYSLDLSERVVWDYGHGSLAPRRDAAHSHSGSRSAQSAFALENATQISAMPIKLKWDPARALPRHCLRMPFEQWIPSSPPSNSRPSRRGRSRMNALKSRCRSSLTPIARATNAKSHLRRPSLRCLICSMASGSRGRHMQDIGRYHARSSLRRWKNA
jgi:hypothetical protein